MDEYVELVMFIRMYMPILVSLLITVICNFFIYRKVGYSGWVSIIPVYNYICMLNACGWHPALCLLIFVPYVGGLFALCLLYKFARCFGIGLGMFLVILFLPVIGMPIWAFSKKYQYGGVS